MKDYSFKTITANNLPIYLHGAFGGWASFVLDWLKEHGGKLAGVFDKNFLAGYNTDKYADFVNRYNGLGIKVEPIPNDVTSLPRGIVIVAVGERYQRECQAKWEKDNWHEVVDVQDIICYPEYLRCLENYDSENLLKKCASCPANYRHCPVRSLWYEKQTGRLRNKVVRHIAVKAGFICNLKCKYCCEYLPQFEAKHKRRFNSLETITDIKKLSDSLEYIKTLSLSGGDVMLNKGLASILEATAKFDNIGDIYLLTNGTYIPHADILDVIERQREKIHIIINGYARNNEAVALIDELNARKIRNILRPNGGWFDLNDLHYRGRCVNDLKNIYESCAFDNGTRGYYHIMMEGKINQRCGVANSILYYLDKYHELTQDYIDIRALSQEEIPAALTTLEDRGYLDACNFCESASVETRTLAAAEEQIKEGAGK